MILLIIFGTKGVTSTVGSGPFWCPSCNMQQYYQHKKVRRYFTLYWIPLIPLDTLGEYIECGTCGGTFQQQVLSYNPQGWQR